MFRILSGVAFALAMVSAAALAAEGPVAAPPAAGPVYIVGYVEIIGTSVPAALMTLREYRDASAKEPASMGVQLYREDAMPNRFMVTEAWRQQADYDAHLKAASTMALVAKLRPIQAAPPDMRAHRGFAAGAPPAAAPAAAPANTVYVMSHLDVAPPLFAQLVPNLRPYVEASRKDRGMVRFDVLQAVAPRQNHLTVLEAWAGATPHDAHKTALHTRTFRDRLHPLLGALYDERVYRAVN